MDFYEAQAPLIMAGIFIFVGVLSQLLYLSRKKSCTDWVDGVVIGYDKKVSYSDEDSAKTTSYSPICRYDTGMNTLTSTGIYSFKRRKYKAGQSVTIFYDPNNVEKFYVAGEAPVSTFAAFMLLIGVVLLAVGIAAGLYII